MTTRLLALLSSVILYSLLFSHHGNAMKFEFVETDVGERILIVAGRFDYDDDLSGFTNAIRSYQPDTISFDSAGGNPHAAMKYGRRIRALGLNTLQVRKLDCMSACALAFLGGIKRDAQPGSIGVHQSSFTEISDLTGHEAVAAIQVLTAETIAYMSEMGVSSELLQLSLAVGKDDIRFLTGSETTSYRVTGSVTRNSSATNSIAPASKVPRLSPSKSVEVAAYDFIRSYHDAWSKDNGAALSFMSNAYEDVVDFYGKSTSRSEVFEEKRRFARRWPDRLYEVKTDTFSVRCASFCKVSAVVVWYAHSTPRNASSSGEATFTLVWNPSTGRIASETGKVVAIDRKSGTPAHMIDLWHTENSACRGSPNELGPGGACERRDRISDKLSRVDWCYGRQGEAGYQHNWHRCEAQSFR